MRSRKSEEDDDEVAEEQFNVIYMEYDDEQKAEKDEPKRETKTFTVGPEVRPSQLKGLELYSATTGEKVDEALRKVLFHCEILWRIAVAGALSRRWREGFLVVFPDLSIGVFATPIDFIDYCCNPLFDESLRANLIEKRLLIDQRLSAGPVKSKVYRGHGLLSNFRISQNQFTALKIAGPEHRMTQLRDLIAFHAANDLTGKRPSGRDDKVDLDDDDDDDDVSFGNLRK